MFERLITVADSFDEQIGAEHLRRLAIPREQIVMTGDYFFDGQAAREQGGFRRSHISERAIDYCYQKVGIVRTNRDRQEFMKSGVAGEINGGTVPDKNQIADVGEVVACKRNGEGRTEGDVA